MQCKSNFSQSSVSLTIFYWLSDNCYKCILWHSFLKYGLSDNFLYMHSNMSEISEFILKNDVRRKGIYMKTVNAFAIKISYFLEWNVQLLF